MSAIIDRLHRLAIAVLANWPRLCEPLDEIVDDVRDTVLAFHRERWPGWPLSSITLWPDGPHSMEIVRDGEALLVDGYGPRPLDFLDAKRAGRAVVGMHDFYREYYGCVGRDPEIELLRHVVKSSTAAIAVN